MFTANFTTIDNRPAFLLPEEAIGRFRFSEGEQVRVIESPAGLMICRTDEQTARQLEVALDVMDRRRDALRRLAE